MECDVKWPAERGLFTLETAGYPFRIVGKINDNRSVSVYQGRGVGGDPRSSSVAQAVYSGKTSTEHTAFGSEALWLSSHCPGQFARFE
jgi:hypothetical protein